MGSLGPTELSFSTALTLAAGVGAGEVKSLLGWSFLLGIWSQSNPGIHIAVSWNIAMICGGGTLPVLKEEGVLDCVLFGLELQLFNSDKEAKTSLS